MRVSAMVLARFGFGLGFGTVKAVGGTLRLREDSSGGGLFGGIFGRSGKGCDDSWGENHGNESKSNKKVVHLNCSFVGLV